jgi:hypothetical protein
MTSCALCPLSMQIADFWLGVSLSFHRVEAKTSAFFASLANLGVLACVAVEIRRVSTNAILFIRASHLLW